MDLPQKRPPAPGWFHQIGARVLTWWTAKMSGTILGMVIFFVAYFRLLRHPLYLIAVISLIAVRLNQQT
ncbi:MAG: hypothetical protein WC378_04900 [Opitutaceae bacterium]|jgi:hypothetical protein